jgi:hypothetical protein
MCLNVFKCIFVWENTCVLHFPYKKNTVFLSLVLPEFLKNKNFINGKSPSFARILEKYPLKMSEFLRKKGFEGKSLTAYVGILQIHWL